MIGCIFEFTCQPVHRRELTVLGRELMNCAYPIPTTWDDTNPFLLEDYAVFMRFDGLEIRNSARDPRVLDVGFLWRDNVMCLLHVEGARLQSDDELLRLRGIEGRQCVRLS